MFSQIFAVTGMTLSSIRERLGSSLVAIIGIAGVVAVLVGIFSMREGFRAVLDLSGADDVAVVLRTGATDEMGSGLSLEQTRLIADAPGVKQVDGKAIASPELYVVVDVPLKSTDTPANVPLRGVTDSARQLRHHFKIAEGRDFVPGRFEVIVGRGASLQFKGLTVGSILNWGTTQWTVTGIFEDQGSVSESEVWTDATVLQGAYHRGNSYQSMRVKLTSADAFKGFKDALTSDPRMSVTVYTERKYYEQKSEVLIVMVSVVGSVIAGLMGIGAVFGALNTMYSAVSSRTREIATLRAIGFGWDSVTVSVVIEAMLLGLLGGIIGSVIAYFVFNGVHANTMNFSSFSQITFAFSVTPRLLLQGLIYALILGFIGGLLPAIRAGRLPITTGLREL